MQKLLLCAFAVILLNTACSKTKEKDEEETPSGPTNGTATLILEGKEYQLDCLADRSVNPDGCGKISLMFYKSGLPSITFYHFPEAASGTFSVGDGNTQRACNQVYAYLLNSPGSYSKNITLNKTGVKSFTYTGTVYDPVTGKTYTVSGAGSYKN